MLSCRVAMLSTGVACLLHPRAHACIQTSSALAMACACLLSHQVHADLHHHSGHASRRAAGHIGVDHIPLPHAGQLAHAAADAACLAHMSCIWQCAGKRIYLGVAAVQAEAIRQTGDLFNRTKLTPFVKGTFDKLLKLRRQG